MKVTGGKHHSIFGIVIKHEYLGFLRRMMWICEGRGLKIGYDEALDVEISQGGHQRGSS